MLRPGVAPPQPVSWRDVGERVLIASWEDLERRTAGCLDGATAAMLPEVAASADRVGEAAAQALGAIGHVEPDEARRLAVDVMSAGLGLALRRQGWAVENVPGAPVRLRAGSRCLEPFVEVARLLDGEVDGRRWSERCAAMGIANLPLRSVLPARSSNGKEEQRIF